MRKTIFILVFVLMVAVSVMASDTTPRFFYMIDFSQGRNTFFNPYNVPSNQATDVQNIRINDIYGAYNKRDSVLIYGSAGLYNINSVYPYYMPSGVRHVLTSYDEYLAYDDSFTTLHRGLTQNQRWRWSTYNGLAIGVGDGQPLKWDGQTSTGTDDGDRTAENLMAELGAPFAELNTGTNLDASSWYGYMVAMFDSANAVYYYSQAHSNLIQTGAAVYNISLTGVPLGAPQVTDRILYRTVGYASKALALSALAAGEVYRCGELNDNSTVTFADTVADGDLDDDDAPTWSTVSAGIDITPPTGKYILMHNKRIFISGNTTYPNNIYFSEQFYPDWWRQGADYESIRPDDGDVITGMFEQLGLMTVFLKNSIIKYYTRGTPSTDWYVSNPFSNIGCPAPDTICNTPKGIEYLGYDGIYVFDGQYSTLVSSNVTGDVKDINPGYYSDAVGAYTDTQYYLAYTSKESGGTTNNRVLINDIVYNTWILDTLNVNSFGVFRGGTDSGDLYAGCSDSTGYVWIFPPLGLEALYQNTKTDFENGTISQVQIAGTEDSPILEIGWGLTIDSDSGTIDDAEGIIDRPDTSGYWISPVFRVDADNLVKLYWGEELTDYGNITINIRSGADAASCAAASWSTTGYSDPIGSDISGETANTYIQLKVNFTTTDIYYSPSLIKSYFESKSGYVIKLTYLKGGTEYETGIYSLWEGGWTNFGVEGVNKRIRYIKIFYTGNTGEFNVNYYNNIGNVNNTITVDMSVDPALSNTDEYTGESNYKVYTYQPPINSDTYQGSIGEYFRFMIYDTGANPYTIYKIIIRYDIEEEIL